MEIPGGPPEACPGSLRLEELPVGTRLLRIHRADVPPLAYNERVPEMPWEGGRFDNVRPGDGYAYAGQDMLTAVAETLLRKMCADAGASLVPRAAIAGKAVTTLEVAAPLGVLAMHGDGLIGARVPPSVFACEPLGYETTREWAESMRGWKPEAAGIAWRSRFANDGLSYVLYRSAVPAGALRVADGPLPLDGGDGLERLLDVLRPLRFTMATPR